MAPPMAYGRGMACSHTHAALVAGAVDAAVHEHAASCEACAELLADDARLGKALAASDDAVAIDGLKASLAASLAAEGPLSRPSRWSTTARVASLGMVCFLLAAAGSVTLRPDAAALDPMVWGLSLALTGLTGGGLIGLALRPLHRPEPSPVIRRTALALGLLVPLAVSAAPLSAHGSGSLFSMATALCLSLGSAIMAVVLTGWRLLERRRQRGPWWLAVGAGAASSHAYLLLHCPVTDLGHTVVGHGGLGLLWVMGGLVIAARGR